MDKRLTFLTEKDIDKNNLIQILKNNLEKIPKKDDKIILQKILTDFSAGNFSLLTTQEIQYLNTNLPDRAAPYLIFRYKFKTNPIMKTVSDFPIYLLIEPVSACNLRCTMCFQIDKNFSDNQNFMGMMDLELFKQVIDQAYQGGTGAITLASRGEPTLHPKLGDMLEYCAGKFFELKLNTNATKLNEKLIHQILKSDVTDVVFSVDSYTKEDFEKIRVGAVFEQVINNIQKFKMIREQFYPNSKCATRISGVQVDKKQDPKKFKEFWEKYVDHVTVVPMQIRWDTYHNPKEIAGTKPCDLLWERMYVWYDGICNPCDMDYMSKLSTGSVKDKSIREIWHGELYSKLRDGHLNGKRNSFHPCDRCPYGS